MNNIKHYSGVFMFSLVESDQWFNFKRSTNQIHTLSPHKIGSRIARVKRCSSSNFGESENH